MKRCTFVLVLFLAVFTNVIPSLGQWVHEATLVPDNVYTGPQFGSAVALDDDLLVVGSSRYAYGYGAAFLYSRSGDSWVQELKFTGGFYAKLGYSADVCGNTAIIGAVADQGTGMIGGAAYIVERSEGGSWGNVEQIFSNDLATGDGFGGSVSTDGNYCIIGATWDDNSHGNDAGAAYIFEQTDSGWNQVAKLIGSDAVADDHFGISVAIDGDWAIVGSYFHDSLAECSGAAYVYKRSETGWLETAKLVPSVVDSAYFGQTVIIEGNRAIVSAVREDYAGLENAGVAYVFEYNGIDWQQVAKLTDETPSERAEFGYSLALDGSKAIVGSPFDDITGVEGAGSLCVFECDNGTWQQTATLIASDPGTGELFGQFADLDNGRIAVSARLDQVNGFSNVGSVDVFQEVPEPAVLTLLCGSLVALGLFWRKKK